MSNAHPPLEVTQAIQKPSTRKSLRVDRFHELYMELLFGVIKANMLASSLTEIKETDAKSADDTQKGCPVLYLCYPVRTVSPYTGRAKWLEHSTQYRKLLSPSPYHAEHHCNDECVT